VIGIVVVLLLAGPPPRVLGSARAGTALAPQQILRIGFTPQVGWSDLGLDPDTTTSGTDLTLDVMLFAGLVRCDQNGVPHLEMATRYTLSADKRTYTFTLRRGMRFADGSPITAQDVVWSWNRAVAVPNSTAGPFYADIAGVDRVIAGKATSISGVRALDNYTVQVTAVHPASYLLSAMCTGPFMVLKKANVLAGTKKSPWALHAIGSGMYTLKEWKPGVDITLVANPYYYGHKPTITTVTGSFLGTTQTQLVAYENSEFDIIFPAAQDVAHFLVPGGPHHDELVYADLPFFNGIGVRTTTPPTDDVHVRQALAGAIDTDLLAKAVLHGIYLPAHRMLWPNQFFPLLHIKEQRYDPASARKLLAMSKYGANVRKYPPIKFIVAGGASGAGDYNRLAVAMQQMWQQNLGLTVQIVASQAAYIAASQKAQLTLASWWNDYGDPQEMFHFIGNGKGGVFASYWVGDAKDAWDNPTFDALDAQQAASFDPQKRARFFAQMDQIWTDSASWIPVYWQRYYVLKKPWVRNWQMIQVDSIPFVQPDAWIAAH
jgi:ABC-type transport system substrate-binding protein